jgi:hypothetical protein
MDDTYVAFGKSRHYANCVAKDNAHQVLLSYVSNVKSLGTNQKNVKNTTPSHHMDPLMSNYPSLLDLLHCIFMSQRITLLEATSIHRSSLLLYYISNPVYTQDSEGGQWENMSLSESISY